MIMEETNNETINKNHDDGNRNNHSDPTSSSSDVQQQDEKLITLDASPEAIREAKSALNDIFEQIFTKQHVETDEYLQSHMTPSLTLPINAVLEIPRIRAIAADAAIVREVLQESKMVTVNGDLIKLNIKLEQNTVILRDIAKETNENDIRSIFEGSKACPDVINIRSDVGDTWFVTFASEDDAKAALHAITGKTFNDKPVKGRLKQESLKKSFFSSPTFSNVSPPNGVSNAGGMYAGPAPMGVPPIPLPFPPPFFAPMQNGFMPGPGGYPMDVGGPKLFMPPIMHGMAQGPGQQGQMLPNMGNMRRNNNKGRGRGQNQGPGSPHQQGQVAWFPVPNMGMMPMMGGGGRYNPRPYMGNQQQMGGPGHQRRSDGNGHDHSNNKSRGKGNKVDSSNGQMTRQSPKVKNNNNNNNNNHHDGNTGVAHNNNTLSGEGEKKKKAPKQKKKGNSNEESGTAATPGSSAVVSGDLENSGAADSSDTVSSPSAGGGDSNSNNNSNKDKDIKDETKKGSPRSGDTSGSGGNRDQPKQKNKNNNNNNNNQNNQNQNQKKAVPPPNFNLDSDFPSLEGEEGLVVQTPSPRGSSPKSGKQISAGAWAAAARTGNSGSGIGAKEKVDTPVCAGEVESESLSNGNTPVVVVNDKNNSDEKKVNVGSIEVAFGDINVSKGREAISSSVVMHDSPQKVVVEPFNAQDLNSNVTPVSFGRFEDSVNISSPKIIGNSDGGNETNNNKATHEKSSSSTKVESGSNSSNSSSSSNTGTRPATAAAATTKASKNKAKTKAAAATTSAATTSSAATVAAATTTSATSGAVTRAVATTTTSTPTTTTPTTPNAGVKWGGKKSFSDVLKSNKV